MIVEIDHILVAVADPDAAAASLAATFGLRPAGGGVHPAIGTRNALSSLGGPYVEMIGPLDESTGGPGRAQSHPIGDAVRTALRDGGAGAYVTVALRSDDVRADTARLRAAGSPLGADIVRRARPDGSSISWPVAFPPRLGPAEPAFLIEHGPDEPERAARLHDPGPRLARLSIRVADPAAVAAAWWSTLGIRFGPAAPGADTGPGELWATVGPHVVALIAGPPARHGDATVELVGAGPPGGSASVGRVVFTLR